MASEPVYRFDPSTAKMMRMVKDPEFAVEGIEPKHPGPFVREIVPGVLRYVGFTQRFERHGENLDEVRALLAEDVKIALNVGKQAVETTAGVVRRYAGGLECLEEYVGAPIDPAACRLAVLRPLVVYPAEPWSSDPRYRLLMECGLDLVPRRRS